MSVSVSTHWRHNEATISVTGDVDLAAAPAVDRAIDEAVRAPAEAVFVDLTQVTFLDSSGISTLLRGRRLADEHHIAYQVAGAHGLVLTVLEVTGVWSHLSGQVG